MAFPAPPAKGKIRLAPTKHGGFFLLVLLGMLLGSANYGNNLGFLVTFILAGLAAASLPLALAQVRDTQLRFARAAPIFAAQPACFVFTLSSQREAPALELCFANQEPEHIDLPGGGAHIQANVCHLAAKRGMLRPGPLKLSSIYPLGLFRAWRWLDTDAACLVYPAPSPHAGGAQRLADGQGQEAEGGPGVEEFQGLREYAPGDPLQRIAWKASQRGHGLLTKEFEGQSGGTLLLDFEALAPLPLEERLSRLCRLALETHDAGQPFALRLPEHDIPPAFGEAHLRACLKALALHGSPSHV